MNNFNFAANIVRTFSNVVLHCGEKGIFRFAVFNIRSIMLNFWYRPYRTTIFSLDHYPGSDDPAIGCRPFDTREGTAVKLLR